MRACLVALFLAVMTSGCVVVVLGDSNSCMWPDTGCAVRDSGAWPTYMTSRDDWPLWTVKNRALPSMTAGNYGGMLTNGEPSWGKWHLERLIRDDLADACTPIDALFGPIVVRRKLVIALGTNDLPPRNTPTGAGLAVRALYDRAIQVPCVDVYVATVPPRWGVAHSDVDQVNALIRMRVPANRIVPFGDVPIEDLLPESPHFTVAGQEHRAALAFAALWPAPPDVGP